jgi:hypothetical protein
MGIKIINYGKTTQMEPRRDQEEDGQTHRPTLHLHQEVPNFAVVNQIGEPKKTPYQWHEAMITHTNRGNKPDQYA